MFKRLVSLIFILYPILDIYGIGIPGISIGKLISLVLFLIYIFIKKGKISLNKVYILFIIFLCVVPFIINFNSDWFNLHDYIYKTTSIIVFSLIYGMNNNVLDLKKSVQYYKIAIYICVFFFYIQEFSYFVMGNRILGIIPYLPLADSSDINLYIIIQSVTNRSCSFFLEPSHFVYYISVYYVIITLSNKKFYLSKVFWLLTITIICTRTGNGVIILVVTNICAISKLIYEKELLKVRSVITAIFFIIVSAILLTNISSNRFFKEFYNRKQEISNYSSEISSGSIRIYSGYYFLSELNLKNLLFGVSVGNVNSYYLHHDMKEFKKQILAIDKDVYLNTIQLIIGFGGIFSLLLYLDFLYSISRKNNSISKTLILLLLISNFVSSNFLSGFMLMVLVYSSKIKNYINNPFYK